MCARVEKRHDFMIESCSLVMSLSCVNHMKYVVFVYLHRLLPCVRNYAFWGMNSTYIRPGQEVVGTKQTTQKTREMGIKLGSYERNNNLLNLQHTVQHMRESAASRLLGLRVRIPLAASMFVSYDCCVFSRQMSGTSPSLTQRNLTAFVCVPECHQMRQYLSIPTVIT
jgi:hypothetical protein